MKNNHSLTDSDLEALRQAVYGGPRPELTVLQRIRSACSLPDRGHLQAVRPPASQHGCIPLHPDLWLRAAGSGMPYAGDQQLIQTIQRAIVADRLQRLESRSRAVASDTTWQRERELRELALASVRRHDAERDDAVRLWWQVVCRRHVRKLDAIRRKAGEFLAALTAELDEAHLWSRAIVTAQRAIGEHYDLDALLAHLLDAITHLQPVIASERAAARDPLVRCTLDRLHADFDRPLSIEDLAAEAGVSRAHLMRRFKRACGQTILGYQQALRIEHAQTLLRSSDESLIDIATACGFGSQEHFQRIFKRLVGTAPGRFREVG